MNSPHPISRRGMLLKLGIALNGAMGVILALPVVRYLLSPVIREAGTTAPWVSLGALDLFPQSETRLATYRHPAAKASDGETANVPCWVRNIDGKKFQIFAINCAHLGCPVRWFPQSGLFMCPCHGGAYYRDGSRASGPPERGLFEYPIKIQDGAVTIRAGELPTPGPNGPAAARAAVGEHAEARTPSCA